MDILGQEPTLASDAEWLLQSGNASVESLVEVLTKEHYRFIYHFALMLTDEQLVARDCTIQVLTNTILQASQYSGAMSLRAWLASSCLQACNRTKKRFHFDLPNKLAGDEMDRLYWQAINDLSQAERIMFILKAVFEIPINDLAKIFHQENSDLERNVHIIYTGIQADLQPLIPNITSSQIDQSLKEFSNRLWPLPDLSEEDMQRINQKVENLVLKQLSAQKHRNVLLVLMGLGLALIIIIITVQSVDMILPAEPSASTSIPIAIIPKSLKVYYQVQPGDSLESIARKTGMTPAELSSMNAISSTLDLYEGQELAVSVPGIREPFAGLPQTDLTPTVQPLTLAASPSEIREMMVTGGQFWHTLWLDTQEATGSLEPSKTNGMEYIRRQVWIQKPDRSYEITKYLQRSDQMDYYRTIVIKGQGYYAFGSNSNFYWDVDWQIPPGNLLYNPFLDEMVLPGQSSLVAADRQYQVLGESEVAGRKALMVDTRRPGDDYQRRIWIDVQTGVILRYQLKFPDQNGQKDFIVTALAFNIPIPPALFDPRQPKSGGFAMDYSGWAPAPDPTRATDTPAFSLTPVGAP